MKPALPSLFGEKWRPPRCFYSTACRTRPLTARRTTEYSRNALICTFFGLLRPIHIAAVNIILRYLRGTPDLHITYSCNSNFELIGFCEPLYGTGNPEKASTLGSMYFISGGVIDFSTSIQQIAAQSTTEVGLICAKQEIYLCIILR